MTTQRTGQGQSGGTATSIPQEVANHLQSISGNQQEFLSFFGEIVRRASDAGVSQQQLLDYVSDNYKTSGK